MTTLHEVTGDLGIVKTSEEVRIPRKASAGQSKTTGYGLQIWRGIESLEGKALKTYAPIFAAISADSQREETAKAAERELRAQLAQYRVDCYAEQGIEGDFKGKSPAHTIAASKYGARSNKVSRLCLGIRVAGMGRYEEVEGLSFDHMLDACRAILAEVDGRLNKDGTIRPRKAKGDKQTDAPLAETDAEVPAKVDANDAPQWMRALEALVAAGAKSNDPLVVELSAGIERLVQERLAAAVASQIKAA